MLRAQFYIVHSPQNLVVIIFLLLTIPSCNYIYLFYIYFVHYYNHRVNIHNIILYIIPFSPQVHKRLVNIYFRRKTVEKKWKQKKNKIEKTH